MRLIDADALKKAIPNTHVDIFENCRNCRLLDDEQVKQIIDDTPTIELLKEKQEEHKRMLSWLSKFCRHIDNGDKWLTDEENLAFFKEKMKQQFGWDTD